MKRYLNWSPNLQPPMLSEVSLPAKNAAVNRVIRLLIWLVFLASIQPAVAFQESEKPTEEPKLPKHATWRLGEFSELTSTNGFYRLAFSPDGKLLATRNQDNMVAVYDVANKKQLSEIGGHENWISSLQFSPDSKTLMTASGLANERIKTWEPTTGKLLGSIEVEAVHAVYSESGKWIYALTNSHVIKYDAASGEQLAKTGFRNGSFRAKAVSRDGRYVIVSHRMNNNRTYITKRIDLKSDSSVILPGPPKSLKSVEISNDNRWIAATFHDDPSIRLWSLSDPNDDKFTLHQHEKRAQSIDISPDSRFLVSTSWDKTAVVWDLMSRESLGTLTGHTEHVNSSAFAPDSMLMATGASGKTDSSALVWNLENVIFPTDAKIIAPEQFQLTWNSMGSTFGRRALDAVNDLRSAPKTKVLEFVKDKMGFETQSNTSKEIERWIKDLDSSDFKVREAASKSLTSSLLHTEQALRQTLETDCSAEVRFRIRRILGHEIAKPPIDISELRRFYRAIYLLELIAADADHKQPALEILQYVAKGHRHLDIARDAAAAAARVSSTLPNQNSPPK